GRSNMSANAAHRLGTHSNGMSTQSHPMHTNSVSRRSILAVPFALDGIELHPAFLGKAQTARFPLGVLHHVRAEETSDQMVSVSLGRVRADWGVWLGVFRIGPEISK